MKISITVPVYNVEPYIEKCARSLFEQTFADIEYIFVNDCTPDASESVLLDVIEDYPDRKANVKIIRHEHNMGLPAARKTGLDASSGEYVYFCDCDDWLEKDALEKCINIAESEGVDIVCFCHFTEKDGLQVENKGVLPKENRGVVSNLHCLFGDNSCLINMWNKLIRRQLFEENDIKFARYNMGEDFVLSVQLFYYTEKVYFLDECLYHYNTGNPASICHLHNTGRQFEKARGLIKNLRFIESFVKDKGLKELRWGIDYMKYCGKQSTIYRFLPSISYQWHFLTTFPELFFTVFADRYTPVSGRIKYYLTLFGLWPAPYKILMRIKHKVHPETPRVFKV